MPVSVLRRTTTRFYNRWSLYKFLLVFGVLLTVIQQMPVIRDNFYNEIRIVLYIIFGMISISVLRKFSLHRSPILIKLFIITIILTTIEILCFKLFGWNVGFSEILELLVPFGILISSYMLSLDPKEAKLLIGAYVFLSTVMGVSLIFYYGQGFIIMEQYLKVSKNQTGPILAISCTILVYQLLNESSFTTKKLVSFFSKFLILGLSFMVLLVIRNRSGILGFLILAILMIINKATKRILLRNLMIVTVLFLLIFIMIISGLLTSLLEPLVKAFILNYDISDLDSLSAGRTSVYFEALQFLLNYPIFGKLSTNQTISKIPHNYVLNKWVEYGLIGSIPFVMFYIYLWSFAIRRLFYQKKIKSNNPNPALWLLLLGLIISIFEYTYPYGPGVSQIMVWFCLGIILRSEHHRQLG